MKSDGLLRILIAFLVLSALALLGCNPSIESEPVNADAVPAADNTSADTGGPPPLVVDMDTPLLLDEPVEGEDAVVANTKAAVENTACFVCHANYMTESLASHHGGVNIGCIYCHGESIAHRNDENNTTPPEIMYPAEKIDPYCQGCHGIAHDIPPRMIIARWKERNLDKTKIDPYEIVCTDCHGDHRMRIRTVIWDKKSGKLLKTNIGD
ncbi:cytochrome c3 family protein [Planctomycetota bacterium]